MTDLDWDGMVLLGIGVLKLEPEVFWNLTPREFLLLAGAGAQQPTRFDRSTLTDLMARFPDQERNN